MAKNKIIDMTGNAITTAAPKIKEIIPTGNQVLVERLKASEVNPSSVVLSSGDEDSNQAYILALGPQVSKEYGIKVGDRVFLQGSFVPAVGLDNDVRQKNLIYADMIKAVLIEG